MVKRLLLADLRDLERGWIQGSSASILTHHLSAKRGYTVSWAHRCVALFDLFLHRLTPETGIKLPIEVVDRILEVLHLLLIRVDDGLHVNL